MAAEMTQNGNGNGKPVTPAPGLKRFGAVQEETSKGPSKIFTDYYVAIYLFLVAAFAASAVLIHRPMIMEIKRLNAETQNRLASTGGERTFLTSVEGSVAAAQSIPPEILQQVDESLPLEQNIPSLLVQFGAAALANSVNIDTIAFVEPKGIPTQAPAQGLVVPMDVSLTLRAPTYFEMKRFLSSVENNLRLMDVQSIALSGTDKGTTFSIQLRVYTYQPPVAKQASLAGASATQTIMVTPAGVPELTPKP